jgi:hypothetical protein
LTAADDCRVLKNGRFNNVLKTPVEGGVPIEGGLASRLVKKSTSIFAMITTKGGKVTQVSIVSVESEHFFFATILKIEDNQKVTLRTKRGGKFTEITLTASEKLKVIKNLSSPKKREIIVLKRRHYGLS